MSRILLSKPMRTENRMAARSLMPALLCAALAIAASAGCNRDPQIVPVEGTIYYRGKPLTHGSVMFQPAGGQPARGQIQTDGSFRLSTYRRFDGAAVGGHRVRVVCNKPLENSADEEAIGESLIPKKYNNVNTSGLTVEVSPENRRFEIELNDA